MRKDIMGAVTAAVGATVLMSALLAGCSSQGTGKYNQPGDDAPVEGTDNGAPAMVIAMPDGFSNIAVKCVDGWRYVVAYHGDSPYGAVSMVADPGCK